MRSFIREKSCAAKGILHFLNKEKLCTIKVNDLEEELLKPLAHFSHKKDKSHHFLGVFFRVPLVFMTP